MNKEVSMMVGPTAVPERILTAMNKKSISHRSGDYMQIHQRVREGLKKIFNTKNEVYILTSSGTGAMEAAIQNCFSFGDEVVIPVMGVFSEQFAEMAEAYKLNVKRVNFPLGEAADVSTVMDHVTDSTKGVIVIHNESATGVTNDIESFGNILKDTEILLITDSVSGAVGIQIDMDNWGIDVVLTGSQKALMVPSGLSFISLSEKAWKATERSNIPNFYFDLKKAKKFQEINQTPNTPAVYTLMAVDEALKMIFEEGLENVQKRHTKNRDHIIKGIRELGLEIFPRDEKYASKTLTAVYAPGMSKSIVKGLADKGVIINGGLASVADDVFRVGTMGYVYEEDVNTFLVSLKQVLEEV